MLTHAYRPYEEGIIVEEIPVWCLLSLASMTAALESGTSFSVLGQQCAPFRRCLLSYRRNAKLRQTVQTPLFGGKSSAQIVMGNQGTEAVTAHSSVPEILQTKGRTVRVNYIRRDGIYEVG